jgi:hypothetical protein
VMGVCEYFIAKNSIMKPTKNLKMRGEGRGG